MNKWFIFAILTANENTESCEHDILCLAIPDFHSRSSSFIRAQRLVIGM